MNAAKRLKKLRIDLKKSQQEMADELHIEQSSYSRYETGKTLLSINIIQIIFEKYGISPSEFFSSKNLNENNYNSVSSNENEFKKFYIFPKQMMDNFITILEKLLGTKNDK